MTNLIMHIFPTHNGVSEQVDVTYQVGGESLADSWAHFHRALPRDTVFSILGKPEVRSQYADVIYHTVPYTV